MRIREKQIGNTVYTIIARQKPNAKETAFDITKRLIEQNAESLINTESLESCNSGGNKQ
ncbi:MAG: transposon-encoded TnpW family protein [Clostridia bacterium]|nr:transposon-encoded TnpW family protein [Clostridia bacterium]